jgi:glycosyltransferase involved in cell wall biosynthesis
MKISVIIPVRNRAREVREAIASALAQTLAPAEIIVVDDGSTDDTAAAVAAFNDRVKLIRQEQKGAAAARNRGAKAACGDWLAFLDSDDLWLPAKLAEQAAAVKDNPRAGLVHTDGWVITGRDASKLEKASTGQAPTDAPPTHFSRFQPARGPDALVTYLGNPMLTPSVMISREAFERAGGFDESFTINEDADLFVRVMASRYETVYADKPLVIVRTLQDGIKRTWMEGMRAAIRVQKKALAQFPALRRVFRAALAQSHRSAAQCALVQATKSESIRFWLKSFTYRRPSWKEIAVAVLLVAGGEPGKKRVMRHWKNVIARYQ